MKRIIRIISVVAMLVFTAASASAQKVMEGQAEVKNLDISRNGDMLDISMDLDVTTLSVGGDETVVLTPVIEKADKQTVLPAIEIMGRRAYLYYIRNGEQTLTDDALYAGRAPRRAERKSGSQIVTYSAQTSYEAWMKGANVVLKEGSCGCSNTLLALGDTSLGRALYVPYTPQYALAFLEPEPEPVKVRDESMSAYINFKVDKYEILEDYRNNARELSSVIESVEKVANDGDLTITSINIEGWASPEGSEAHNLQLSQNRADALADYMTAKTGIARNMIATTGRGEDWAGLRKCVDNTPRLLDRDKVYAIIDDVNLTQDQKDKRLAELIPPTIYQRLMNEMYPMLRRNDYKIVYNVRNFNMDEARALIDTDPRKLSVGEMYRVAGSYPKGSAEYNHVMEVAFKTYPAQTAAAVNAAAVQIAAENFDGALQILARADADNAAVLNAQGVAYSGNGAADKAREAFVRAAEKGNADASHNLKELERSLE